MNFVHNRQGGVNIKVKRKTLLLIASLVWMAAGFNISKIGFLAYISYFSIMNIALTSIIFFMFWFFVFNKLVTKHTKRITEYLNEKQYFWNFFDIRSFFIMAMMITFGIVIRSYGLMPEVAIAVFYTGLGTSLLLDGIKFGINFIAFKKQEEK